MTTLEKNMLIAKFDGLTIKDKIFAEWLKYHNCWDWLMPVIEKIAKLEIDPKKVISNGKDNYFDSYCLRTFAMINVETKEFMVRINHLGLHQSNSLLEATFDAVVEFIIFIERDKND